MKPIDMKAAKERLERKRYAALVLSASDELSETERRKQAQRRAEVERKAKKSL